MKMQQPGLTKNDAHVSAHAKIPTPSGKLALKALQTMLRTGSPLPALEVFHGALGKVFRANLPSFKPIMTAGAEWARWLLVEARESFLWKAPKGSNCAAAARRSAGRRWRDARHNAPLDESCSASQCVGRLCRSDVARHRPSR
jgi:hypothetical protein